MLFTHKLHMGGGAGQSLAGHRAPNTDVRAADSQAVAEDRIPRMRRRDPGPGWVGGTSKHQTGAVRAEQPLTLFRLESSPEVWVSLTSLVSPQGRSYQCIMHAAISPGSFWGIPIPISPPLAPNCEFNCARRVRHAHRT